MEAKEKAKELVDKYKFYLGNENENIKEAVDLSLIAVDEIIKSNPCYEDSDRGGNFQWNDNTYYWQQVKNEIYKL